MNKVLIALCLLIMSLPAMADIGNDSGMPSGNSVSVATVPQSTVQASITEARPQGTNLSEMIRRSRPYNGLNPTTKAGEVLVQLPCVLSGVEMLWQQGTYKGGWYTGYLEKGESVYAWVVEDCSEYTDYRLSRGRCGNPTKPVTFRKGKYIPAAKNVYSTTMVEKTVYREKKKGPGLLSFSQNRLVPDTMPTTVLGPRSEARVGLFKFNADQDQDKYCSRDGGAPSDPGGHHIGDNPEFVPGLSDQPIDR